MLNLALRVDHMAYVTFDMRATARFWTEVLGLTLVAHVYGDRVPSTREPHPYLHLFFGLEDGSDIAFFQIRGLESGSQEVGINDALRYLALEVESDTELDAYRRRLEAHGVPYSGPDRDELGTAITFYDPNEIRVQIRVPAANGDAHRAHDAVAAWVADYSLVRG